MASKKYITLEHLTTAVSALLNKIAEKANIEDLSDVAFSGSYTDLENKPDLTQYVSYDDVENLADGTVDGPFMIKGTDYVTAGQLSGTTLGTNATAEGYDTTANGAYSHAEGNTTIASGYASHAEGDNTTASRYASHAEGGYTAASGEFSHAEGYYTTASGSYSHAEGYYTTASGNYSQAEGRSTTAQRRSQHVFGEYNVLDATGSSTFNKGSYIEIVGNGTSNSARSNARTLDWSGNETLAGKLTVGVGPTNNMDVATKQYVDTGIANIDALPSQSGNSGKFLTTNGTTASWSTLNLSDYVPTSTTTSYGDGSVVNTIDNSGLPGYGNVGPCIELRTYYTEPNSAGENDTEAFLQIDPIGVVIGGSLSFAWGGLNASDLSSGTVNWNRLPTSRIYDATASRTANTVLAAPNGSAGAATFRKLVEADLPTISGSKISGAVANATTAASCSGNAATVSRATFGDSSNGTHDANAMTSNGLYYYSSNGPATSIGASTTDGAIYCQAYSTSWVGQIAQDYRDGDLFIRGKNNGTWQSWKRVWVTGDAVTGAVWNDYAEYRETDTQEFGRCVIENGDDTMSLSTKRLQKGCSITSDTWGFAQGQTEKAKTPIAVSGRVLAYPFEDKEEFRKHIGDAVCSGPEGTVSIMTDEEVQKYPLSIIGTISAVPDYEEWGGGSDRDPVKVNGRVWIRIQ